VLQVLNGTEKVTDFAGERERELVKITAKAISIFAKSKGSAYFVNAGPAIGGRGDNREGGSVPEEVLYGRVLR
jgi:hypothetical protein